MRIGYATTDEQRDALRALGITSLVSDRDALDAIYTEGDTVVVRSLMDLELSVTQLDDFTGRYDVASYDALDNPVKFFADMERAARRARSRRAADQRRENGERLGPRPLIDRMSPQKLAAIRRSVMDPDLTVAAICRRHGIDRRTLRSNFGDELTTMGKI